MAKRKKVRVREPLNEEEAKKPTWKKIGDTPRKCKVHPLAKFNYDYVEVAARLKAAGFTDADVAFAMSTRDCKITQDTISGWKDRFPQFKAACNEGRRVAQSYLVAQAIRAAAGYDYEECNEKLEQQGLNEDGTPNFVVTAKSTFKKHQKPDAKLLVFLLSNMDPEQWKVAHKVINDESKNINIHIDGKIASDQINKLAGQFLNTKQIEATVVETEDEGMGTV
jgi:hypothetical protein